MDYFVHESSYVDEGAVIGAGTRIWHFCHIQSGAVIGRDCSLGQNVNVGPRVRIGNGVRIQNNVSIYEGVELEDHVFCGPSCALIAAGAVVTGDVKEYALMAGVPARRIGWVCECGEKLNAALHCSCGRKYRLEGDRLVLDGIS